VPGSGGQRRRACAPTARKPWLGQPANRLTSRPTIKRPGGEPPHRTLTHLPPRACCAPQRGRHCPGAQQAVEPRLPAPGARRPHQQQLRGDRQDPRQAQQRLAARGGGGVPGACGGGWGGWTAGREGGVPAALRIRHLWVCPCVARAGLQPARQACIVTGKLGLAFIIARPGVGWRGLTLGRPRSAGQGVAVQGLSLQEGAERGARSGGPVQPHRRRLPALQASGCARGAGAGGRGGPFVGGGGGAGPSVFGGWPRPAQEAARGVCPPIISRSGRWAQRGRACTLACQVPRAPCSSSELRLDGLPLA